MSERGRTSRLEKLIERNPPRGCFLRGSNTVILISTIIIGVAKQIIQTKKTPGKGPGQHMIRCLKNKKCNAGRRTKFDPVKSLDS